jgi:hypothetical protein
LTPLIKHIKTVVLACFLLAANHLQAQYKIQGTVYDSSRSYPMVSVSVLSTNGKGTVTDVNGRYSVSVGEKDSIWFSYLGKPTVKFPVLKISDVTQFDIALQVSIQMLKEVKVLPRNYKQDSIQNRLDYAKIFDYRKPNLESMTSIGPTGAGIDINEVIRMFQFRKSKSTLRFQERLMQQEQDKSIDHRFSKALVRRLTNLTGEELDKFMALYRPTYEFTLYSSDYDFQLYIKESYKMFIKQKTTAQY